MSKIVCCPLESIPDHDADTSYFALCSYAPRNITSIGHVAPTLKEDIKRFGLSPSVLEWDFAMIALSIAAADSLVLRRKSADGWTRMVDVTIHIQKPEVWNRERLKLEKIFRFLTGDFWEIHFQSGGVPVPVSNRKRDVDADCVCLLSGGVDSLVGAIDLTTIGRKPLLVSRIARGDRDNQLRFASELGAANRHCQWSCSIKHTGESEHSTRGRSIIFFAFALLASSAIDSTQEHPVDIFVPENGFISLNIPLGPGRIGSLSTKTTHPVYTGGIQNIWDCVGIHVRMQFPYKYKTKGEMLQECKNRDTLIRLIGSSVSCGKYNRHNLTHCGVCIPCLVRRAAFNKANITDTTVRGYCSPQLKYANSGDVAAAALAYVRYHQRGIGELTRGFLRFADITERRLYEDIIARGLNEIGELLESQEVV